VENNAATMFPGLSLSPLFALGRLAKTESHGFNQQRGKPVENSLWALRICNQRLTK
jgi:hypothetical protein